MYVRIFYFSFHTPYEFTQKKKETRMPDILGRFDMYNKPIWSNVAHMENIYKIFSYPISFIIYTLPNLYCSGFRMINSSISQDVVVESYSDR